jgi:hypothetical protein
MSLPTSKFSKLSLGKMPITRAQGSKISQADPDTSDSDDSVSDSENEIEPEPETPSKLTYDKRELSPAAIDRLHEAFRGRFNVDYCGERHDGLEPGTYFAFQVAETVEYAVRIGAPGSTYQNPKCSKCNDTQPCRHIFWLLDQIAKCTVTEGQRSAPLTMMNRGYPSELPHPFDRISNIGIEELAERMHWDVRPVTYSEPDLVKRAQEIRDILAFLSPVTAEEYMPKLFEYLHEEDYSDKNIVRPRDLESTLASMLMAKPSLFQCFRSLISPDHCASDFFQKMREKAEKAMLDMDYYLQTGISVDNHEVHDIPWCARTLINVVASINKALFNPKPRGTLGRAAKEQAAIALVWILGEVANRDVDVYAGAQWANSPQRRLPNRDRNLFERLIVHPSRSTEPPFIINELKNIEPKAAQSQVERMDEINEILPRGGAPKDYLTKFRELIVHFKTAEPWPNTEAGPSGAKRAGSGPAGRDSKRMK